MFTHKNYAGAPERDGNTGKDGNKGDRGEPGPQGPPGPRNGGVVFTRWGHTTCPTSNDAEVLMRRRCT